MHMLCPIFFLDYENSQFRLILSFFFSDNDAFETKENIHHTNKFQTKQIWDKTYTSADHWEKFTKLTFIWH